MKIWAFEAIPSLGHEFARKLNDDRIPRMSRWAFDQPMLEGKKVDMFLEYDIPMKNAEVIRTLVPSSMEADSEFWQGMTPVDGVEASNVDDNLNEDGEKDAGEDAPSSSTHHQPCEQPSSAQGSAIAEVILQEMREIERRLQQVITDRFDQLTSRCDRMESKLDRVLQLLEKNEFQSERFYSGMKGFNTCTPSGDNVQDYSPRQDEEHLPEESAEGWLIVG